MVEAKIPKLGEGDRQKIINYNNTTASDGCRVNS